LCYAVYDDTEYAKFALLIFATELYDPFVLKYGLQKAWMHYLKVLL